MKPLPPIKDKDRHYWIIEWVEGELLANHAAGVYFEVGYKCPRVQALTTMLFRTRKLAREFRDEREPYGKTRITKVYVRLERAE